jgi:hypothetical protein
MGTATMASYARPFHTCHFYEIDEQVRLLSLPEKGGKIYFGYVNAALERGANIKVLMGDARLRMAMPWVPESHLLDAAEKADPSKIAFDKRGGPENYYHLMVVDAFSSDAIPRHLITKEAMEMYFRHLVQGRWGAWVEFDPANPWMGVDGDPLDAKFKDWEVKEGAKTMKRPWIPGGVLCVHTSNRHLRLVPVVADTAAMAVWEDRYDLDENGNPKLKGGANNQQSQLVSQVGHDAAPGCQYLGKQSDLGHYNSEWVIVARDAKDVKHLVAPSKYTEWMRDAHAIPKYRDRVNPNEQYWSRQQPTNTYVWTDDHTNLMAVFRWPWDKRRE